MKASNRDEFVAIALEAWQKAEERYRQSSYNDEHVAFQIDKAGFYSRLALIPTDPEPNYIALKDIVEEDDRP